VDRSSDGLGASRVPDTDAGLSEEPAAFVTGGARGIGAAICRQLAHAGVRVAFCDLRIGAEGRELSDELARGGAVGRAFELDVTDVAALQDAIRTAASEFGRLDILVNNAGVSRHEPIDAVTQESWDAALAVNLRAVFFAAQAAAPYLTESGRGRIINVSSELAHLGSPMLLHYTAAKGGVLALTRSLALALAPSVNVNVVVPGPTDTELFRRSPLFDPRSQSEIPIGRFGVPHDIALTVAFLAGEGGAIYTGQQFDANGGVVMP
jgi:NAD(P)-dependent dehydrogenase (short-subunit alcohol dehydrogenase family)